MFKRQKELISFELTEEEKVIKRLERHYRLALEDVKLAIQIMQADEATQAKIHHINYQKKLQKQLEGLLEKLHMGEYKTLNEYLNDCYTNGFVGTMYDIAGQGVPIIAPIDQNAAVKAIQLDTQLSDRKIYPSTNGEFVTLYESLGVDIDKLKRNIRSEITRGISSGMNIVDIARNISYTSNIPLSRAKTIARTEAHRIQQLSAEDAWNAAKARGADVLKKWTSKLDGKTRGSHRELDGQIRETHEDFFLESKSINVRIPGQFGDPAEDCNCRCRALPVARWYLDEDELENLKKRAEYFKLDKTKDFKDFKEKYLKAAETVEKSGKSGIIEPEGVLDKFDRKARSTGLEPDLKASNPKYGSGTGYTQNCQRCVPAYELRRRGYNVQAKPAIVTPTGKLSSKDPIIQGSKWMNGIFGNIQWKKVWTGNGLSDIENAMAGWGDGARAEVYVNWKNGGAHVFIAEQVNGQTRFLDPQSGAPDYRSKFANVKSGYTMFARIDNLPALDAIEECVENVR